MTSGEACFSTARRELKVKPNAVPNGPSQAAALKAFVVVMTHCVERHHAHAYKHTRTSSLIFIELCKSRQTLWDGLSHLILVKVKVEGGSL